MTVLLSRLLLVFLWLSVIGSALGVIYSAHIARGEINQLTLLKREAQQLHVEWGQYLLEQSAWSAYSRIEQQAVDVLHMRVPDGEHLVMVQK